MRRSYEFVLKQHFKNSYKMAFITGPRQVGKTTTCKTFNKNQVYINWDNEDDRQIILKGPKALVNKIGFSETTILIFDELHKYPNWKNFLKGFYDTYAENKFHIIITGSARFDIYRKGADSLMGRYFLYRMHPITVGEILHFQNIKELIRKPKKISDNMFNTLITYGGFPEPFLKKNSRFYNKWRLLRKQLLFREDIRDLTKIFEIGQVEVLAEIITQQATKLCNYSSIAKKIRASENSIRRWINVLESLYYCFLLRPWTKNITRSLVKEPKIFLWDWSVIKDKGALYENFIASHLLKTVNWWQDNGYGEFALNYIRTKDKREVDFLVSKNNNPWFLVEVKAKREIKSKNLEYFQNMIKSQHAFQVIIDETFVNKNCFSIKYPIEVPAKTFLSQLM